MRALDADEVCSPLARRQRGHPRRPEIAEALRSLRAWGVSEADGRQLLQEIYVSNRRET
jgi:hypothetical protein